MPHLNPSHATKEMTAHH